MKSFQNRQHITDLIFVLALFCVFAVSSILLVTLGSTVYRNILNTSETNYSTRTPYAYLVEKFHQNEGYGRITLVENFGDSNAIIMTDIIDGQEFETKLYTDQGYLKELFYKKGTELSPSAGDSIIPCKGFQVEELRDDLYHISYLTEDDKALSIYITNKGELLE